MPDHRLHRPMARAADRREAEAPGACPEDALLAAALSGALPLSAAGSLEDWLARLVERPS